MAHIGSFKESSNGAFEGEVFMPHLNAQGVRIVKLTTPSANKKAPTHRILLGRSEVGSAWQKTTADDRDYLSLTFDFPGLVAPVYAILIKDLEGDGYSAYWSRSKKVVFE
jgi:uncharacterized protein (DUF736 family)